ncbi:antibiotic biosynthesis monooxygenase family protein [uncultured Brevundimonas sp.]|uniref:antibiotic biosynthesis monooxygenase family protein n=1 Tax=uncultured Brevundimonas sp. TaxID=213418 RepID=UPI0030EC062D|tara:strand:+ start:1556 stop:1864 length:309 start_codon:yes stop_codon:yes gene_type:complete
MTETVPVVLINVFKCDPAHQDALMDHLAAMARIQAGLDGFVSQTLHRGLNGKVVANHAVWSSAAAWKAMARHPAVAAAMEPVMTIATFEPHLYDPGAVITPA